MLTGEMPYKNTATKSEIYPLGHTRTYNNSPRQKKNTVD